MPPSRTSATTTAWGPSRRSRGCPAPTSWPMASPSPPAAGRCAPPWPLAGFRFPGTSSPSSPLRAAPRLGRRRRRWWPPRRRTTGAYEGRPSRPIPNRLFAFSTHLPSAREYGLSMRGAPLALVRWVADEGMGSTGECEMGSVSRGLQTPSNKSWSDTESEYVAQWAP